MPPERPLSPEGGVQSPLPGRYNDQVSENGSLRGNGLGFRTFQGETAYIAITSKVTLEIVHRLSRLVQIFRAQEYTAIVVDLEEVRGIDLMAIKTLFSVLRVQNVKVVWPGTVCT
jgi:hypothetical protein